jgi:hypothetical protein
MSIPTSPSSRALIPLPIVHSPSQSWSTSTSPESNIASTSATLIEYQEQEQWQPILHASNQVVLYNSRSHALSITSASAGPAVVATRRRRDHDTEVGGRCPYCKQGLPVGFETYDVGRSDEHIMGQEENQGGQDPGRWGEGQWDHDQGVSYGDDRDGQFETLSTDPAYHFRASNYFRLLAIANERSTGISSSSIPHDAYRVGTSSSYVHSNDGQGGSVLGDETHGRSTTISDDTNNAFPADKMAEGYFKTFFQEEVKLGMGANGSVFLCQVHICIYARFKTLMIIFDYSMF